MSITYKKTLRLGELLIQKGLASIDDIIEALGQQKINRGKLGDILVKKGIVYPEDIVSVLAEQFGITKAPQGFWNNPPVGEVPVELVKKYRVFPVSVKDRVLRLVVSEPSNINATDEIRYQTGLEVVPELATVDDVERAIHKWYGTDVFADPEREESREDEDDAEGPAARMAQELIEAALLDNASDIHIEPHRNSCVVRYRVDGILRDVTVLSRSAYPQVLSRLKVMSGMDIAEKRLPQDGWIRLKKPREVDLRVSSLATVNGEKLLLRVLDKTKVVPRLENLGYEGRNLQIMKEILQMPHHGLILLTGPTGSGKTTTLYAAIAEIVSREINVITVEDPPEYEMELVNQVAVNKKAGLDFAAVLRAVLRQDPDVIMVGEIRDPETAQIAVRAALTGHLVLSTLHTNDAASAPVRLVDMGVEPYMLASTLLCVVSQRLVRVNCERCAESYVLQDNSPARAFIGDGAFTRGKGCVWCNETGYKGRTAVMEILRVTESMRELFRRNAPVDEIRRMALKEGMTPLFENAKNYALAGKTTPEEVMRVVALTE
ncbi:MAG: Flp pilus assembly complex ATPase component TadA [Peptococcaceae bacterium]|nr:Flp pilus assembly complex ATPase component TadA [Peptococcaceae bacterium]